MSDKPKALAVEGRGSIEDSSRLPGSQFVVVAIKANQKNRYVEATGWINNLEIGTISAADNYVAGVISSSAQMMTLPIPPNSTWKVQWNVANHDGEVKVWLVTA